VVGLIVTGACSYRTPSPGWVPSAAEVAKTWVGAGLVLTVANGLAIAVMLPWPEGDAWLRLQHHFFDALHVTGLAAIGALVAAAFSHAPTRWRALGWALYAAITCSLFWALLDLTFTREAFVIGAALGFDVPGPMAGFLRAVFLLLIGLSIPVSHWVTKALFHFRFGRAFVVVVASIAIVVGYTVLRDEYEDVHTAILWPAAMLLGACLLPLWPARLEQGSPRTLGLVVGAGLAAAALLVPPPNQVRRELFRTPGAIASFALAQTIWRVPTIAGADRRVDFADPRPIPQGRPLVEDPVVFIVGIDAMRGDLLTGGQYDGELRNLSRIRDDGAYFTNAIAPGSQTSVTYTSIFSGRYSSQLRWGYHGLGKERRLYAASDPSPRVAELLGQSGVRTVSFLSPGFLRGDFGIARGFDEENLVSAGHALAGELMRPLLKELRPHQGGGALFFVHFMDAHEPYDRGPLKNGLPKERYLSELLALDRLLGTLIHLIGKTFPGRGYVVVLADHGEAFGEHGMTFHSKTLYQELIHVPLIFYGPGIAAQRHDEWVSLIDVAPTLLALYGRAVPASMMGESLLPALMGEPQPPRVRPIAAEGRQRQALLWEGGLKAIEDRRHKTIEVYDLVRDPEERVDLVSRDPARAAEALSALRSFFAQYAPEREGYRPPYKR
jgi:hypothetical protein